MRFSQRIGKTPATKVLQLESIDTDLRNALWNAIDLKLWAEYRNPLRGGYVRSCNFAPLLKVVWADFLKEPIDEIPARFSDAKAELRRRFYENSWDWVFDFVDYLATVLTGDMKSAFIEQCNLYLERENSAYRFVASQIVEITSEQEIEEIEAALAAAQPYAGVNDHLQRAIELMSDRDSPDFRNSIKESISAVESLARHLTGDESGTLGAILKRLDESHGLHPALKSAFSKLYGFTSDSNGVRHALMEEDTLAKADARFMLVCCSAFVNYTIDTLRK